MQELKRTWERLGLYFKTKYKQFTKKYNKQIYWFLKRFESEEEYSANPKTIEWRVREEEEKFYSKDR